MKKVILLSIVISLLLCPFLVAWTPDDPDRGKDKKIAFVKGEIISIDTAKKQIVVRVVGKKTYDQTVQVIAKTIIKDKSGKLTFDDLKVGMNAVVKGQYKKDKILYAYYIGVY